MHRNCCRLVHRSATVSVRCTKSCIYSQKAHLRTGESVARNMLGWFKKINKRKSCCILLVVYIGVLTMHGHTNTKTWHRFANMVTRIFKSIFSPHFAVISSKEQNVRNFTAGLQNSSQCLKTLCKFGYLIKSFRWNLSNTAYTKCATRLESSVLCPVYLRVP